MEQYINSSLINTEHNTTQPDKSLSKKHKIGLTDKLIAITFVECIAHFQMKLTFLVKTSRKFLFKVNNK